MKKFFVSKSDKNKIEYLKKAIETVKPDNVYILVENDRACIFKDINATILPLKELNKTTNWITFINTFTKNSMLVIDNVLKFIFFGDGKKKYLKDISQSINNIIVMDVVPFYTEPYEIFYPFYLLGKEILGYNSYNTFKANHLEESKDGKVFLAHSFEILKDKIKDYYVQDYAQFWNERTIVEFQLTMEEEIAYNNKKTKETDNFTNPIKLYNACSVNINLIKSRFEIIDIITQKMTNKKVAIVINALGKYPSIYKNMMQNKKVDFLTIHSKPDDFINYDYVILAEMPIVKPHNWIYIEPNINGKLIQLKLSNNKLENMFYNKIFNNELKKQFDAAFYNADM